MNNEQNVPPRVRLRKQLLSRVLVTSLLSPKMLTSAKSWPRFVLLDSLKHHPLSAQLLIQATFQPLSWAANWQFTVSNPNKILTVELDAVLLAFSTHHCSDSQQATFPPAEATPFHYKPAAAANTCSLRWRVTRRQYRSRSETQWPVCNVLACLLCVAPVLAAYKNNISSVVFLPPSKIKLYLAPSPFSFPAKLPSFSDLESRAGRQKKGEKRGGEVNK